LGEYSGIAHTLECLPGKIRRNRQHRVRCHHPNLDILMIKQRQQCTALVTLPLRFVLEELTSNLSARPCIALNSAYCLTRSSSLISEIRAPVI
jgi:hypothetical protein